MTKISEIEAAMDSGAPIFLDPDGTMRHGSTPKPRPTLEELETILAPTGTAGMAELGPFSPPIADDFSLESIANWLDSIEWTDDATAREAEDRVEALRALARPRGPVTT